MNWDEHAARMNADLTKALAHGSAITYTPTGGGAAIIFNDPARPDGPFAEFRAETESIEMGETDLALSALGPSMGVALGDFTTPPRQGDTALIDGVTYRVVDITGRGDGAGARLILRKS